MAELSNILDTVALVGCRNLADPGTEAEPSIAVCNGEVTGEEIGSDEVLACRLESSDLPVSSMGADFRVSTGAVSSVGVAAADVCTEIGADAGAGATPEAAGGTLVFV